MFVGETGIGRVVQQTCELMREHTTDDVRRHGGIDLATHPALPQLPLLGVARPVRLARSRPTPPTSTPPGSRAASRRPRRPTITCSRTRPIAITRAEGDGIAIVQEPALHRAERAAARRLRRRLPARRRPLEHRHQARTASTPSCSSPTAASTARSATSASCACRPTAAIVSQAEWDARHARVAADARTTTRYVASLMKPVVEPGKFAGWIAPPARGINGQPMEFEYVKLVCREAIPWLSPSFRRDSVRRSACTRTAWWPAAASW